MSKGAARFQQRNGGRGKPNGKGKARAGHDHHKDRVERGQEMIMQDEARKQFDNDWKLDWFTPQGRQADILSAIEENTFTIIDGPSGSGKTSCALYKALCELKDRQFRQMIFVKNPTECGDDKIGYLTGNEQDKLQAHYETTKRIFHNFISKEKLENDIRQDRIRLMIPNFLLGATFDNAIVIIDEAQVMSVGTVKLLLERIGKNSKYIILGDAQQRYSASKRNDGFTDFIKRVTYENHGVRFSKHPTIEYIKLTIDENMRSEGSKLINKIYEDL